MVLMLAGKADGNDVEAEGAYGANSMEAVLESPDSMWAKLKAIEELVDLEETPLPDAFSREVWIPDDCRELRVGAGGNVVGFTVGGSSEPVLDMISAKLRSRGWTAVSLGDVQGATFLKQKGFYRWLMVACVEVGDDTSVVMTGVSYEKD